MKEVFLLSLLVGVSLSQQNRRYQRRQTFPQPIRNLFPASDPFDTNNNRFVNSDTRNPHFNSNRRFQLSDNDARSSAQRTAHSNVRSFMKFLKRHYNPSSSTGHQIGPLPTLPPVPSKRRSSYVPAIKRPSYMPSLKKAAPQRKPSYLPTVRGVDLNTFPLDTNPFSENTSPVNTGANYNPDTYETNNERNVNTRPSSQVKSNNGLTNGLANDPRFVNNARSTIIYDGPVNKQAIGSVVKNKNIHKPFLYARVINRHIDPIRPVAKVINRHIDSPLIRSVGAVLTASNLGDVRTKAKSESIVAIHGNQPSDSDYSKPSSIGNTVPAEFVDNAVPANSGHVDPVTTKHAGNPGETYTGTFMPGTDSNTPGSHAIIPVKGAYEDPIVSGPNVAKDVHSSTKIVSPVDGNYIEPVIIVPDVKMPQGSKYDSKDTVKDLNYDKISKLKETIPVDNSYVDHVVPTTDITAPIVDTGYENSVKSVSSVSGNSNNLKLVSPVDGSYVDPVVHVDNVKSGKTSETTNYDNTGNVNLISPVESNYVDPAVVVPNIINPVIVKEQPYEKTGIVNTIESNYVDPAVVVPNIINPVIVKEQPYEKTGSVNTIESSYIDPVVPHVQPQITAEDSTYDNIENANINQPIDSSYVKAVDTNMEPAILSKDAIYDNTVSKTIISPADSSYVDPVSPIIPQPDIVKDTNYDNTGITKILLPVDSSNADPLPVQSPNLFEEPNYDNTHNSNTITPSDSSYIDPVVPNIQSPVIVKDIPTIDSVTVQDTKYDNTGNKKIVLPVDNILVDPFATVSEAQSSHIAKDTNYDNAQYIKISAPVDNSLVEPVVDVPNLHNTDIVINPNVNTGKIIEPIESSYVESDSVAHGLLTQAVVKDPNYQNKGNTKDVFPINSGLENPNMVGNVLIRPRDQHNSIFDPTNEQISSNYDSNSNHFDTFRMAVPGQVQPDILPPVEIPSSIHDLASINIGGVPLDGILTTEPEAGSTKDAPYEQVLPIQNREQIPIVPSQGFLSPAFDMATDVGIIPSGQQEHLPIQTTDIALGSDPTDPNYVNPVTDPSSVPIVPGEHNHGANTHLHVPADIPDRPVNPVAHGHFEENPWSSGVVDPVDTAIDTGIAPSSNVNQGIETTQPGNENYVKDQQIVEAPILPVPVQNGGFLPISINKANDVQMPIVIPQNGLVVDNVDPFSTNTANPLPTLNGVVGGASGTFQDIPFPPQDTGFLWTDASGLSQLSPEELGVSPFDNPAAFDPHFDHPPLPSSVKSTSNSPGTHNDRVINTSKNPSPALKTPVIFRPTASNIQDAVSRINSRVTGRTGAFDSRWDNPLVPSNRTGTYVNPKPLPPVDPSIAKPTNVQRLFERQDAVESEVTKALNKVSSRTLDLAEERRRRRQQLQRVGYPSKYAALRAYEG